MIDSLTIGGVWYLKPDDIARQIVRASMTIMNIEHVIIVVSVDGSCLYGIANSGLGDLEKCIGMSMPAQTYPIDTSADVLTEPWGGLRDMIVAGELEPTYGSCIYCNDIAVEPEPQCTCSITALMISGCPSSKGKECPGYE